MRADVSLAYKPALIHQVPEATVSANCQMVLVLDSQSEAPNKEVAGRQGCQQ